MKVLESYEIAKVAGGLRVFEGADVNGFEAMSEGSLMVGRVEYDSLGRELQDR